MKNKIEDLRNHLFVQLEKLADDNEPLDDEVIRAKAICEVAKVIIDSARTETEFLQALNPQSYIGSKHTFLGKEIEAKQIEEKKETAKTNNN
jgi:hypothetical protein